MFKHSYQNLDTVDNLLLWKALACRTRAESNNDHHFKLEMWAVLAERSAWDVMWKVCGCQSRLGLAFLTPEWWLLSF